eukprot:263360-Rhodomonas_salina.7
MRTEPVGAARVRRAAAAMQEHINLIRRQECADKPEVAAPPFLVAVLLFMDAILLFMGAVLPWMAALLVPIIT